MESEVVELRIRKVSLEDDEPVVILDDRASARRLVLPIGPFEASAIIMEMEGITPPRPLTHDLLAELFTEAGFYLDGVELFGESADRAQALLQYHKGLHKYERAVRPSDALALALRLEAPVCATSQLLDAQEASLWRRPKVLQLDQWRSRTLRAQ